MPVKTYRARRPVNMGALGTRLPGELVPEGPTIYLLDSLIHVGKIVPVEVSNDEFLAAIDTFCPDRKDELLALVTLDDERDEARPKPVPPKVAARKVTAKRVKRAPRRAAVTKTPARAG